VEDTRPYPITAVNGNGHFSQPLPPLEQTRAIEDEEEIDLHQLLNILKRRWFTVVGVAVSVTAAVGLWSFQQEPIYEGKFQLLMEPPSEPKSMNPLMLEIPGTQITDIDYQTQIEVLLSSSVIRPIAQHMIQRYPEAEAELLKGNKKDGKLQIEQLKDTKILEITFQDPDPEKIQFVLNNLADAYLKYSLKERQSQLNQGIDFTKDQLPQLEARVDKLQQELQQFRQKHNLLDPTTQAQQLSEQLVLLDKDYIDTQVRLKEAKSLYGTLQKQLQLDPSGAIASSYLAESPRYQNLLNQLQQVEIELAKQSARFYDNNPTIIGLKEQRQNLLPLLQQEASSVLGAKLSSSLSNSPALTSPSSVRLGLNQKFIESANQLQVLEVRRGALEQATQSLNSKIKQMPVIARQYTDLQLQIQVATESLTRLLSAQQDLQLEAAQQALPWEVISRPEPAKNPIYPKIPLNLALGGIGGLLLGFGVALLGDRLDPKLHSVEELKEMFPYPLLTSIPYDEEYDNKDGRGDKSFPLLKVVAQQTRKNKNNNKDKDSKEPKKYGYYYSSSAFEEAFRSLNTNIRLLGSDRGSKSLVISSSAPAEGKSTVSVNLAKAAAAMGQRVLLVDADMRRPQVHARLELTNTQGLSNLLANGLPIEELVQKLPEPEWETLAVLSAGEIPPDPTRLLASKRMQDLMEYLDNSSNYDLIVYDTPPILGFADGRILGPYTNGAILVAKMQQTDRGALKQAIDELRMSKVPVLGLVANNVSRKSQQSYYYYNHYHYYKEQNENTSKTNQ
jgi:capsular exopolysaccharide synthesis family protein